MNLFNHGDFTLASGKKSNFKIDCDALTEADWESLAALVAPALPPFGRIIGIPRGGWKFAEALYKYHDPAASVVLLVDDVWTTGGSMLKYAPAPKDPWSGVVLFARGERPPHITVVFEMNAKLLLP